MLITSVVQAFESKFFSSAYCWGEGGLEGVYHQKSCVMSILGFSIVGNQKMMFIFILGYPHPPQGCLQRGGARGGIPPKIMCYVNSGVFNSVEFKNDLHFQLGYPYPPHGRPGGGWGARGGI